MVYGQGLVDAYKAETELARDPRIVLTYNLASNRKSPPSYLAGFSDYALFLEYTLRLNFWATSSGLFDDTPYEVTLNSMMA